MILLKLLLSEGRGKSFITKWLKDKIYLKFGARPNLEISNISLGEDGGRVYLKLNIEADCTSDEFYDILEKIAK